MWLLKCNTILVHNSWSNLKLDSISNTSTFYLYTKVSCLLLRNDNHYISFVHKTCFKIFEILNKSLTKWLHDDKLAEMLADSQWHVWFKESSFLTVLLYLALFAIHWCVFLQVRKKGKQMCGIFTHLTNIRLFFTLSKVHTCQYLPQLQDFTSCLCYKTIILDLADNINSNFFVLGIF